MSGGQAQVEGDAGAFAGGNLLDHAFQVDQLGTEDLQALSQSFDLMLDVFFYGGSFMKTITDVDVHEHLELANERRKPVLSTAIVHPLGKWKSEISSR